MAFLSELKEVNRVRIELDVKRGVEALRFGRRVSVCKRDSEIIIRADGCEIVVLYDAMREIVRVARAENFPIMKAFDSAREYRLKMKKKAVAGEMLGHTFPTQHPIEGEPIDLDEFELVPEGSIYDDRDEEEVENDMRGCR
jgi:hypothetical protein